MKPEPRKKKITLPMNVAENKKVAANDSESCTSDSITEDQHWVQCENPDCLKWRMISQKEAETLDPDEQWFCHINPDVLFSSCDTPEEKYSSNYKMKQHGLTYRYSLLPEGSLVWAKLSGYCKWPSIICHNPSKSDFVILDNDGDPHSYHVEFLGTKHSIAWVHHTKIDAYGNLGKQEALETCSQPLSMISMNRFKCAGKKRKRPSMTRTKKTSIRLAEQLQAAIDEADDIIQLERKARLEKCKIRYKSADETDDRVSRKVVKKRERTKKDQNGDSQRRQSKKSKEDSQSSLHGSQRLSDHKLTDFATKEDRLMADIQGLQDLQQEFIDDYAKFLKRKASTITGPHWQGGSVSLFQLFMAVQEKGGFSEVCVNMRWKEVVMDCCDVITNKFRPSAASTAMTYYSRHLLPYEMHITCSGSAQSLTKTAAAKVQKKKRRKKSLVQKTEVSRRKKTNPEKSDEAVGVVIEDEAVKELKEMEELLKEFADEEECANSNNIVEDNHQIVESQSSMNLYFNDDSQLPKKSSDHFTQLMSQSQPKPTQGIVGVDCEDLFGDVSSSQVVPEVASLEVIQQDSVNHRDNDYESDHSEEDLFAEIDRDEQLLQSLLDTT